MLFGLEYISRFQVAKQEIGNKAQLFLFKNNLLALDSLPDKC